MGCDRGWICSRIGSRTCCNVPWETVVQGKKKSRPMSGPSPDRARPEGHASRVGGCGVDQSDGFLFGEVVGDTPESACHPTAVQLLFGNRYRKYSPQTGACKATWGGICWDSFPKSRKAQALQWSPALPGERFLFRCALGIADSLGPRRKPPNRQTKVLPHRRLRIGVPKSIPGRCIRIGNPPLRTACGPTSC